MRKRTVFVSLLLALLPVWVQASAPAEKPRVFVLTDISNEPDDEESLVRFLVYSSEFDIEGLVATTSTWLRGGTREDLIRRQIEAFGQVRPNLLQHARGYPTVDQLLSITATGQPSFGMKAVGEARSSPGSRLLQAAAGKSDPRSLWVAVWGGANTLAQALWDLRREQTPQEWGKVIEKLRVYTISDQDDAGPWIRDEFRELFYIVSPSSPSGDEYYRATWTGISGDRYYRNGPGLDFALVDNPWLKENIIENHGPLGVLYPRFTYIMEGDTPSFLGLIPNGLGWTEDPAFGGWGGRYSIYQCSGEARPIWTENADSRDTVLIDGNPHTSNQATIWRWRRHYQHDFAARMDWCATGNYNLANHNPVAVLNSDLTRNVIRLDARPGDTLKFSARGSHDPDDNQLTLAWMVYPEAGSLKEEVRLSANSGLETSLVIPTPEPGSAAQPTIHLILTVEDDGTPNLVAYRRAVITVLPGRTGANP